MIIVLLKILLSNITILGNQNTQANGLPLDTDIVGSLEDKHLPKLNLNIAKQLSGLSSNGQVDGAHEEYPLGDLNSVRTREITSKAISGFLLTMLKWFRLSREYTT